MKEFYIKTLSLLGACSMMGLTACKVEDEEKISSEIGESTFESASSEMQSFTTSSSIADDTTSTNQTETLPAPETDVVEKPQGTSTVSTTPATTTTTTQTTTTTSRQTTTTESSAPYGLSVGNRAYDISFDLVNGGGSALSAYRGKVVFLNFFASWCGPCIAEMPDIQRLHENYGSDVHVIVLSLDESLSNYTSFLANYNYTMIHAWDSNHSAEAKYQIDFIPQTYVIDRNGVIRGYSPGQMSYSQMERLVTEALGY